MGVFRFGRPRRKQRSVCLSVAADPAKTILPAFHFRTISSADESLTSSAQSARSIASVAIADSRSGSVRKRVPWPAVAPASGGCGGGLGHGGECSGARAGSVPAGLQVQSTVVGPATPVQLAVQRSTRWWALAADGDCPPVHIKLRRTTAPDCHGGGGRGCGWAREMPERALPPRHRIPAYRLQLTENSRIPSSGVRIVGVAPRAAATRRRSNGS